MRDSSVFHLLDMNELARYVNRHPAVLRKYYAEGILPEPDHSIVHRNKTTRRWTMREADVIATIFANAGYGTFAKKRTRAVKRKLVRRPAGTTTSSL